MTNAPQNPQYPEPGNKYGTSGYDPNQNFEMSKPPQVDRLRKMTLASMAIYLLSGVLGIIYFFSGSGREAMQQQLEGQDLGGLSVDDALMAGAISATVVSVLLMAVALVLYILVLVGIKKRWGWARIIGIVLAILGVLFVGIGLFSGTPMAGGLGILVLVLDVLFVLVNIYWLVLAFNGKVGAWFARRN